MSQKHMLGQKQILLKKTVGRKNIFVKKRIWVKSFLGKKMGKIVFGSKNDFVSTIFLG